MTHFTTNPVYQRRIIVVTVLICVFTAVSVNVLLLAPDEASRSCGGAGHGSSGLHRDGVRVGPMRHGFAQLQWIRSFTDWIDSVYYQPDDTHASSGSSGSSGGSGAVTFARSTDSDDHTTAHEPTAGDDDGEDEHLEHLFMRSKHQWRFAEDVAAEIDTHAHKMVTIGQRFARYVLRLAARGGGIQKERPLVEGERPRKGASVTSPPPRCALSDASTKLQTHEYSHRNKRRNEHTTLEMFQAVEAVANGQSWAHLANQPSPSSEPPSAQHKVHAAWHFWEALPPVLNHFPIALSDDPKLNISKPFGSWHSVFLPIDDYMAHHQEAPIPRSVRPPQIVEAAPPLFAAVLPSALAVQGHAVTCDGHVLTSGGCLWEFSFSTAKAHHHMSAPIAIPLCDKWCNGFYHFTHEHLPRVALVHALLTDASSPAMLVLSHEPVGFAKQFLFDVLGIPRRRVMWSKGVRGDIVVYPMPQRCGNTMSHLLHFIRAIVHARMGLNATHMHNLVVASAPLASPPQVTGPVTATPANVDEEMSSNVVTNPDVPGATLVRLLFAERKHLSRMPQNYFELKKRLMKEFQHLCIFDTIAGDASARDQVRRFYEADVVLGPHGANLANMMWMRRGAHVIEMASASSGNMCYYTTASRIGVQHHLLLHGHGKDAKYTLPYDLFRQHVLHAIESVRGSSLRGHG